MHAIFPNAALLRCLNAILTADKRYRLFTNNITPGPATVIGDFTEAAWAGYAYTDIALADWTLQSVVGNVASYIAAPVSFLNSSGGTVTPYGYYVTDTTGTYLFQAGRFDGAPVSILDTQSLALIPVFANSSKYTS